MLSPKFFLPKTMLPPKFFSLKTVLTPKFKSKWREIALPIKKRRDGVHTVSTTKNIIQNWEIRINVSRFLRCGCPCAKRKRRL